MKRPFSIAAVFLGGLALALALGCSKEVREEFQAKATERKARFEEKSLRDRAEEYWDAFRWQNWTTAATFIEEGSQRVRFLRAKTDPSFKHPKIDELSILYVFVDPKTAMTGEVRVQWNEVRPTEAQVVPVVDGQGWYRSNGRWWVNFEDVPQDLPVVPQAPTESPKTNEASTSSSNDGERPQETGTEEPRP